MKSQDCIDDISAYLNVTVKYAILRGRILRGEVTEAFQMRIIHEIAKKANGMFLLARLQLDQLCEHRKFKTAKDIVRWFERPVRSITSTHDSMFEQLKEYDEDGAKKSSRQQYSGCSQPNAP